MIAREIESEGGMREMLEDKMDSNLQVEFKKNASGIVAAVIGECMLLRNYTANLRPDKHWPNAVPRNQRSIANWGKIPKYLVVSEFTIFGWPTVKAFPGSDVPWGNMPKLYKRAICRAIIAHLYPDAEKDKNRVMLRIVPWTKGMGYIHSP